MSSILLIGLLGVVLLLSVSAGSPPAIAWSPNPSLLGGRRSIKKDVAPPKSEGGVAALLDAFGFAQPVVGTLPTAESSLCTFVIVADTLSRPALAARSLAWLSRNFQAAPSSVTLVRFRAEARSLPRNAHLFDGDIAAQHDAIVAQCTKEGGPQTVVVKVASLEEVSTGEYPVFFRWFSCLFSFYSISSLQLCIVSHYLSCDWVMHEVLLVVWEGGYIFIFIPLSQFYLFPSPPHFPCIFPNHLFILTLSCYHPKTCRGDVVDKLSSYCRCGCRCLFWSSVGRRCYA